MLKKILTAVLLLILFFVSSRVLLFQPLFRVHDFVHGARIAEMAKGLSEGSFPVRWSANFGYGYGMPLFEFYGPLPYFISSLFYLAGFSLSFAVKSLFVLANIITILGAYLLGREKFGRLGGLILSTFYVLAPYRAVNFFVRGALSETWGMAFLPWVLWGAWLCWRQQSLGFGVVALGTGCLILSHNLTALIALPFLLFLVLTWWFFEERLDCRRFLVKNFKKISQLLASFFLGLGLSAFYSIPALLEKNLTQLDFITQTNYFDFHNHFLYLRQFFQENWGYGGSAWGPNDGFSFFLGFPQLAVLLLALIWLLKNLFLFIQSKQLKIKLLDFALPMLFFTLLMMSILFTTQKTLFFWENLPFLSYLQFPWRFLSLITLLVSLVAAWFVSRLNKPLRLFLLVAVFLSSVYFASHYFQPESVLEDEQALFYADPVRIRSDMSGILPDFLPISLDVKALPTKFQPFIDLSDKELASTEIIVDRSQEKLYRIFLENYRVIELPIAEFPGWQIEVSGQVVETAVSDRGLLQLELPKGESAVGVSFQETPTRLIADIVSLLSLLILLVLTCQTCRTKTNN